MVELNLIKNQYQLRKNRELQTESQLRNFLKDAMSEYLSDYGIKRRNLAREMIDIGQKMKTAQIAADTKLDLEQMKELGFRMSAKDKKSLHAALNDAKTYQECCAIAQEFRNRGLHDEADEASQRADIVGYKGYLANPEYRESVKAINRTVTFAINDNFIVKDLHSVLTSKTPVLIPIADVVLMGTGDIPDASDKRVAQLVADDLRGSGEILTSADLKVLNSLDK